MEPKTKHIATGLDVFPLLNSMNRRPTIIRTRLPLITAAPVMRMQFKDLLMGVRAIMNTEESACTGLIWLTIWTNGELLCTR